MSSNVFLVHIKACLVGGKKVDAFDVIEAEDPIEARNVAINFYVSGDGNQAVDFGGVLMFPGTIASVEAVVLAAIDISNMYNTHWKRLLERSRNAEDLFSRSFGSLDES